MLATLFLIACAACLLIGPQVHPMAGAAQWLQISLSASAVSLGVAGVWLAVTLFFGRIYCSTVCPIGTLSDIFLHIRRRIPRLNKPFAYRHPGKAGLKIAILYLVSVVAGVSVVTFTIEPYNMARNISATVNRDAVADTWANIAPGVTAGIIIGIVTVVAIGATSLRHGREFCSRYCPVGAVLGLAQEHARMHIEIDPDRCNSCGLCEERCRTQSIKVVSRYVDQNRCVRCFDCVADCPEGAIRYQSNRNRPASPLMRKARSK